MIMSLASAHGQVVGHEQKLKSHMTQSGEKKRERLCTYQGVGAENGFFECRKWTLFSPTAVIKQNGIGKIFGVGFLVGMGLIGRTKSWNHRHS